ncbi:hypothetical protein L226DRAFT_525482 [Lentinus tigrinus ALCF2SS1-7]|uniref:Ubiquitin 3 binding protein But2 C-terminal domain-containing protein n=1 Tax=Lentinus tigrinus ALCF2SS1-6 TaxID=1328759 RepID=A0A5C2S0A2_9APHY|nr:hypothetical protein L227DRAFT_614184 [Lentinus tigrinus ALCF2SS1-6]RPD71155.1 hypothetical protein L226DRAFT_525482 [Lentinus tigrinus ALCF2SS1-7]
MQLSLPTILSSWAVLATLCASQTVVPDHGTTTEPSDGAIIPHGDSFPFSYEPVPFGTQVCFSAYDPVAIYLSTAPPTAADVTSSQNACVLTDSSSVHDFGHYVVPLISNLPPVGPGFPPFQFQMPTLGVANGTTLYLTVLETITNCKAGGFFCGIETTTVVYFD